MLQIQSITFSNWTASIFVKCPERHRNAHISSEKQASEHAEYAQNPSRKEYSKALTMVPLSFKIFILFTLFYICQTFYNKHV